jgi:hypothetical protein
MVEGLHALPLRHAPTPYGIAADGGVVAPRSGFVQQAAETPPNNSKNCVTDGLLPLGSLKKIACSSFYEVELLRTTSAIQYFSTLLGA